MFDHVLDLATAHEAEIHILNVAATTRMSSTRIQEEVVDTLEQKGKQLVQETADHATQRGVATITEVVQGEPYSTIIEYADARGIDIIVMPTHGRRGVERFLLGSTTERVVKRANVPVLTLQPDDDSRIQYPYQNVLVPTDGSECANQTLAMGVDIAGAVESTLHVLSVITIASLGADIRIDFSDGDA